MPRSDITIKVEEWLHYPAMYRCIYIVDGEEFLYQRTLTSLEELEERNTPKMIGEILEVHNAD